MREDIARLHPLRKGWLVKSGIRRAHWGKTREVLEPYAPAVTQAVDKWLRAVAEGRVLNSEMDDALGRGFAFIGQPGRGKTMLASALLQEIIFRMPMAAFRPTTTGYYQRWPVYLGYYPELLDLAKKGFRNDADPVVLEQIDQIFGRGEDPVQILVIDDLGKEHRTASHWAENFFDQLARSRFQAGLSTIVTTNVEIDDWEDVYGPAMASFAYEALTPVVVERDRDLRRKP